MQFVVGDFNAMQIPVAFGAKQHIRMQTSGNVLWRQIQYGLISVTLTIVWGMSTLTVSATCPIISNIPGRLLGLGGGFTMGVLFCGVGYCITDLMCICNVHNALLIYNLNGGISFSPYVSFFHMHST